MHSLTTLTRLSTAAFVAALVLLVMLTLIALRDAPGSADGSAGITLAGSAGAAALLLLAAAWAISRRAIGQLDRAYDLARLREARLHATLQGCGDALIVTDRDGKVTMLNPAAEALTGWTQRDAEGRPLEEVFRIVGESTREPLEGPVARVLREDKVVGLSDATLLLARDGSERPIDDSSAPIRQAGGETVGVIVVFRDVSIRRQAEQARERLLRAEAAREAAVKANEAKDQFLTLVSHELRAPLAAIQGWLQLLDSGLVPPAELRGALLRISRNTRLQERLVSDLLDVSRIAAGKLEVVRTPVDLMKAVRIAVDSCTSVAQQRGIAVALEIPDSRLFVLGDEQRLVQAIANLVGNGIKFTRTGGSVAVRAQRVQERAVVSVSDTGIGIAPDLLGRLFEPFWQADGTKAREHGGLGLGLAIAKYLVDEHAGTIEAASDGPGSGSTFTISLPVLNVRSTDEELLARRPADNRDLTGIHVLLVDDDHDARDATRFLLQARGAQVSVATSVQEAIRLYDAEAPAVIVSDIGMPEADGYALAAEIRARNARSGRRTPMLALTGYAGASEFREALERGFDAHLSKPVDPDSLAVQIAALVRKPVQE